MTSPSGIVTLTTDFGVRDAYVGVMKGVLLGRAPGLRAVVDLTHEVPPQDVRTAAFHLAHAWRWFPAGTVHVAVVDPGVGTDRAILVASCAGHVFVAPDNGLLGPVLAPALEAEDGPGAQVFRLDVERFALPDRSSTFHGRDVFMPAAAALAEGLPASEAGERLRGWRGEGFPRPRGGHGEVLAVDRFGNLVTNLPGEEVRRGAEGGWALEVADRVVPGRATYAETARGELLALVDSYGLIEIARRDGSAARTLDLGPGAPVTLRRIP